MKLSLLTFLIIFSIFYSSSTPWAMETESTLSPARSAAVHSSPEGEILAIKVDLYPATTAQSTPEPSYPYTQSVVHNPSKVNSYGGQFRTLLRLESTLDTPPDANAIYQSGRQDIRHFGMGEYHFADNREGFLYTDGLKDCIAVVAFDLSTGKSCLYHASKMEIRPSYSKERLIEADFVPAFKRHFGDLTPQVSLVTSAFTQDLLDLRQLLERHGIQIHRINVPDIAMEYHEETRGEIREYISASNTVFVDKSTVAPPLLQNIISRVGIPSTSVIVDKKTGEVGIYRE